MRSLGLSCGQPHGRCDSSADRAGNPTAGEGEAGTGGSAALCAGTSVAAGNAVLGFPLRGRMPGGSGLRAGGGLLASPGSLVGLCVPEHRPMHANSLQMPSQPSDSSEALYPPVVGQAGACPTFPPRGHWYFGDRHPGTAPSTMWYQPQEPHPPKPSGFPRPRHIRIPPPRQMLPPLQRPREPT